MGTKYEVLEGRIAVVWLCNPPLNPLGQRVRAGIANALQRAQCDAAVKIFAVASEGGNLSAGADIKEMAGSGAEAYARPTLPDLVQMLEDFDKPVVAVIRGVALGGGCEVSVACHYRVADASAKIGLPEVLIGLIPGAGGTQRLPRLVPINVALKVITTGIPMPAKKALEAGLIDHIVPAEVGKSPREMVLAAARFVESKNASTPRRTGALPLKDTPAAVLAACDALAAKVGPPVRGNEAVWTAIDSVRCSATVPSFAAGIANEGSLFMKMLQSQQSRARRHLFFAERSSGRPPRLPANNAPPKIAAVGVVGAGTMGAGIAAALLAGGFAVTLVDAKQEALDRGLKYIDAALKSIAKRGRLPDGAVAKMRSRLTPTLELAAAAAAPMVIEAVFENMQLKQDIFRKLDGMAPQGTVLCTNTSTLSVDAIAGVTSRPQLVAGMHFFSPAHLMPLVEVVRGASTSALTLATVLSVARRLPGKVPVVVGNCDGFVGNRMLKWYSDEALFCLEDGASPRQVDAAARNFGMALGPLEMSDVAGNDIGWLIRKERGLVDPAKRNPKERYSDLADKLCEAGRMGHKAGKGWYRYQAGSRKPQDDPEVERMIEDARRRRRETGAPPPRALSEEEITHRLFYPLINEGFRILQEGIADRPADVDVVWAHGYSWPRWRGGPMFWADELGPQTLLAELERYGAVSPGVSHWQPAPLLQEVAASGKSLAQFWAERQGSAGAKGRAGVASRL